MTERLNYQRFAWVRERLMMCNVWQSPLMAAPAFDYREVTALEFIGYAMTNYNLPLGLASSLWKDRTRGERNAA